MGREALGNNIDIEAGVETFEGTRLSHSMKSVVSAIFVYLWVDARYRIIMDAFSCDSHRSMMFLSLSNVSFLASQTNKKETNFYDAVAE